MARKTRVILIDDLDGSEAIETITFGYRGQEFEIDLSSKHVKELGDALQPFMEAGRKIRPAGNSSRRRATRRTGREPARSVVPASNESIRAWAATQEGVEVSSRGRIPRSVREAFDRAHPPA